MKADTYYRTGAGAHGLKRRILGLLLGWAWLDRLTMLFLRRAFFPLSRMWAAAHAANGHSRTFCDAVPMPARFADQKRLTATLIRFEEARASSKAMDVAWERVFFGAGDAPMGERISVEASRLDARQRFNKCRRLFVRDLLSSSPRVRLATRTPAETEALFAAAKAADGSLFALPATMPPIEVSRAIPGAVGRDYWLRFKSPRLGDTVTARVHEPVGAVNPPTVILGHGICIEFDHWRGLVDETDELVARGFRVIRPEAPWHGRRARPDMFGGEPIIAEFPTGALDAMSAAALEWAVLADWARRTSTGPLTMGGTSLGAQTAQLVAHVSRDWPERLRPQALLLITHCGSIAEAVLSGALPEIFGNAADVEGKGWTPATVAPYLALLDPGDAAPLDPSKIVSVLGRYDRVTPFASGEALVRAWNVPAQNLFVLDRGHFSVPMTLIRKPAAIDRFAAVVHAVGAVTEAVPVSDGR